MTCYKKPKILHLLFVLLLFTSCKKAINELEVPVISDDKLPKNVLPKMYPFEGESDLITADYIQENHAKISQFYQKNWDNQSMNGGFLVAQNGKIIYEKYNGVIDFTSKKTINKETPIHIASVSKVITATAILKLINAKRITLDQKVNQILPEFPYPETSIEMLLTHRSGMRNYAYFTDRDKSVWDRHNILSNQDILTILATKNISLEQKPGTHFTYCNTNYAILALIVEKITKLPFQKALKQMIFEPLDMKNTFVFDYDNDKTRVIKSFRGNNTEIGMDYLDKVYGDKNVYSTPRDLLKFDNARRSPHFLNPQLLAKVYKGYSNERKGTKNYGLGIRMVNWDNGKNYYFHNGWWHGFTSTYITLLDEKVTIIALSNRFTRKTYAARKLSSLFGNYPFILDEVE